MSNKDNVIMFPTKAEVPDTITISFGASEPVTYVLQDGQVQDGYTDFTTDMLSGGLSILGDLNFTSQRKDDVTVTYSNTGVVDADSGMNLADCYPYEMFNGYTVDIAPDVNSVTIPFVSTDAPGWVDRQIPLDFDEKE